MVEKKKTAKTAKLKKLDYKIFYVVESKGHYPKKIEVARVKAADQDDAFIQLKKWIRSKKPKNLPAEANHLYVEEVMAMQIWREDGTVVEREFETSRDFFSKKLPLAKHVWEKTTSTLDYWFVDKPRGVIESIKDVFYFMKHRQYRNAYWNLDIELLDTIEHQTKRLLEKQHGIPQMFVDRALEKLYAKEGEKFDPVAYCRETDWFLSDDEMKLAEKLQREAYGKLLDAIKLYRLFYECGAYDPKDSEAEAFFLAHRNLLPRKKGSYDDYDYEKLEVLTKKQWRKIWQYVEEFGQSMYD